MDDADLVFFAPPGELLAESHTDIDDLRLRPNARRRKEWTLDEAALDYYGDWRKWLVRSAVVRARGYDPETAPTVGSPNEVLPHIEHLRHLDHEYVLTFAVNARNQLNAIHETSKGGLHGSALTPRDVLVVPLLTASSGIILVHNHPSGDPRPSSDDIAMTRRLEEAADVLGIGVLDHIIIAGRGYFSMRGEGILGDGP